MTQDAAKAYGCVAYRIMNDEGSEQSEEYLELLMELLYDFYNGKDIQKIHKNNIKLDFYDAIINNHEMNSI